MAAARITTEPEPPATSRRLIDHIGLPSPQRARRLLVLLGLTGDLPDRKPVAESLPKSARPAA